MLVGLDLKLEKNLYIDHKYLTISTEESAYFDYVPTLYFDFIKNKANLKRWWRSHSYVSFKFGVFGKYLDLTIRYNYQERKRTEREEERHQRTLKFIETMSDLEEK